LKPQSALIHKPTGIDVRSTNERSQQANREKAMNILLAKLQQLEEEKRGAEIRGTKKRTNRHRRTAAKKSAPTISRKTASTTTALNVLGIICPGSWKAT
jgi:protein subunit release factor B